jgi:hypothetical protein
VDEINIFKNKIISIVGAAGYIEQSEFGQDIDSSDIVVRINKGANNLNEDNKLRLGSKADVLYHCLLEDPADSNGANMGFILPELWKNIGISLVYCLPSSSYEGVARGNHFHELIKRETVDKLSEKIELKMVDYRFYNEVSSRIQCKPNTGLLALMHVLSCRPKKLKVFGFSFLLDGWYGDYRTGYEEFSKSTNKPRTYEQITRECLESKRHIQKNQWQLCKEMLLGSPNVEVDSILYKILSMKKFSKNDYYLAMGSSDETYD